MLTAQGQCALLPVSSHPPVVSGASPHSYESACLLTSSGVRGWGQPEMRASTPYGVPGLNLWLGDRAESIVCESIRHSIIADIIVSPLIVVCVVSCSMYHVHVCSFGCKEVC